MAIRETTPYSDHDRDCCSSEDRLDSLTPNDIQQHERRTGRPLGSTLQLRNITRRQVQAAREDGLAQMRPFTHRTNFIAADRFRYNVSFAAKMTKRDFVMSCSVQDADAPHVLGG